MSVIFCIVQIISATFEWCFIGLSYLHECEFLQTFHFSDLLYFLMKGQCNCMW